jgi:hypothetical protein
MALSIFEWICPCAHDVSGAFKLDFFYIYICIYVHSHITYVIEKKTYAYPFVLPSIHPPIHPSFLPSFHQLPHACVCKMVSKLERFPSLAESMTFEKEGLLLVCPYMYLLYILCM